MNNSQEMLSCILKTTQMGQIGIRSVLDNRMQPKLRAALQEQLKEYDRLESEAHTLAAQRGWEPAELDPAVRAMADMMTRMKLSLNGNDSKIADMMIQGNTKGMTKGLKVRHKLPKADSQVMILSQKLLDTENANIRQMQSFL